MTINEGILHAQSWSGGKDSTASLVLEHIHRDELKIPPSKVVMAEVMFDNARGISAEYPDHIEWVYNKAKPLLESWGHEVEIVRSKLDYITIFHETIKRTIKEDNKDRIGKLQGFVMGGFCYARTRMKIPTIEACVKRMGHMPQIIGICRDEYPRRGQIDGIKSNTG